MDKIKEKVSKLSPIYNLGKDKKLAIKIKLSKGFRYRVGEIAPGASSAPAHQPRKTRPKSAKKVKETGEEKNFKNIDDKVLFIRGLTAMCVLQLLQHTTKILSTFGGIFVSGKIINYNTINTRIKIPL